MNPITESELEHAHGIIGELLNSVIGAIQAPLAVSTIEGDAVFMYGAMPEGVHGQTVLESVELLYCAFAGALETMTLTAQSDVVLSGGSTLSSQGIDVGGTKVALAVADADGRILLRERRPTAASGAPWTPTRRPALSEPRLTR